MDIETDYGEFNPDPAETRRLLDRAIRKSRKHRRPIASVWHQLHLMIGVIADWMAGRYRDIPYGTIATLMLGIAYFVMPADSIPDFIPGIGFIDDVTVLTYIGYAARRDLERYHRWKEYAGSGKDSPAAEPDA